MAELDYLVFDMLLLCPLHVGIQFMALFIIRNAYFIFVT